MVEDIFAVQRDSSLSTLGCLPYGALQLGGVWFAEEVPYLTFLSLRRVTVYWDHASGLLTLQLGLGNCSALE